MKKRWQKNLETAIGVLVGNIVLAFTVAAFIVPHGIIMGGATGVAITINHYLSLPLSIVVLGFNSCLVLLLSLSCR